MTILNKRSLALGIAALLLTANLLAPANGAPVVHDVILRGGTIYDGSGKPPVVGDVAIAGDRIVALGDLKDATGRTEIDVQAMAVAPGFINVLSWSNESLIHDGRSQGELRQGVTLEVMGEGHSMGPLNAKTKAAMLKGQGDIKYAIEWDTLGGYLEYLQRRGVSCNVASFVGAASVRVHELGEYDVQPNTQQLERMKDTVRKAMKQGALGVASALIYAPGSFAQTDELVELSRAAGEFDGMYISHIRSEANQFIQALDELIEISRRSGVRAQVYHLKAAGRSNWGKMDTAIKRIEAARAEGLSITADMYTYTAGSTGLDASMPLWVQEGSYEDWANRLRDPQTRAKVAKEMLTPSDDWESLYLAAGSPDKVLLVSFKNPKLKHLTGKTLAEVAQIRGKSPVETAIDLVIEDGSRVGTVYFLMSEENVKKKIAQPWVSFNSDSASQAPEGPFLKSNPHPRAYGSFARLLGKYVRDEKIVPLEEAVRRLSAFPAETFKLRQRGRLQEGYFADVVVFDPSTIQDHATYAKPHQYATGVQHVFVNGKQVLKDGQHTGAKPGRVVRGPGWDGWKQ